MTDCVLRGLQVRPHPALQRFTIIDLFSDRLLEHKAKNKAVGDEVCCVTAIYINQILTNTALNKKILDCMCFFIRDYPRCRTGIIHGKWQYTGK